VELETQTALALAKINQARVYQIWFGLGGDFSLTARATGLSARVVQALAHDYNWVQIAGGKLGMADKASEREVNRVRSYSEGHRLTEVFTKALALIEEDPELLKAMVVGTSEDGRRVISAKPLAEFAKAFEIAHSIKYRALGDKIAEEADGIGPTSERIKSLSLNVVNLMNNAATNAKVPSRMVTESINV
jgi:hypothetical protein